MDVGSLFTGYGGLDMAVGGELKWWSDINEGSIRIMQNHYPGIPNLGDMTQIDWRDVPRVDVLTAGYPCQPFSTAGQRKGTNDERHLWPYIRNAISVLRPRITILENVRGHLTLGFADVLRDIAGLGMSARWGIVRASDAGAPHRRSRLFVIAYATPIIGVLPEPAHLASAKQQTTKFGKRDCGNVEHRFGTALQRWSDIIGRSWPDPNVGQHVNPKFVEWMMGLPHGWVTEQGLTDAQQLKLLGNGVVPQQARLALESL